MMRPSSQSLASLPLTRRRLDQIGLSIAQISGTHIFELKMDGLRHPLVPDDELVTEEGRALHALYFDRGIVPAQKKDFTCKRLPSCQAAAKLDLITGSWPYIGSAYGRAEVFGKRVSILFVAMDTGGIPVAVSGDPDPSKICASRVERQNLTMRMQIRRLTRLTNAFSKKLENHKATIALHFGYYNFCRLHGSLRITPAMEAGITDRVWSLAEMLERALAPS